jgi:hypothetical protein
LFELLFSQNLTISCQIPLNWTVSRHHVHHFTSAQLANGRLIVERDKSIIGKLVPAALGNSAHDKAKSRRFLCVGQQAISSISS